MLTFLNSILKLTLAILTEIFEAKKRAREKQEQFELDEKKFYEMVELTLLKLRKDVVDNNVIIGDIEDQMENDHV